MGATKTRTTSRSKKPATKAAASKAKSNSKTSKASKSAATKAATEARAKAKAERENAKAEERQGLIDEGKLVEGKISGDKVEFILVENGKVGEMESRGSKLLKVLGDASQPVSVNQLIEKVGGHRVQLNSQLALLRAEDRVNVYRVHTGDRAGGGIAYELKD